MTKYAQAFIENGRKHINSAMEKIGNGLYGEAEEELKKFITRFASLAPSDIHAADIFRSPTVSDKQGLNVRKTLIIAMKLHTRCHMLHMKIVVETVAEALKTISITDKKQDCLANQLVEASKSFATSVDSMNNQEELSPLPDAVQPSQIDTVTVDGEDFTTDEWNSFLNEQDKPLKHDSYHNSLRRQDLSKNADLSEFFELGEYIKTTRDTYDDYEKVLKKYKKDVAAILNKERLALVPVLTREPHTVLEHIWNTMRRMFNVLDLLITRARNSVELIQLDIAKAMTLPDWHYFTWGEEPTMEETYTPGAKILTGKNHFFNRLETDDPAGKELSQKMHELTEAIQGMTAPNYEVNFGLSKVEQLQENLKGIF